MSAKIEKIKIMNYKGISDLEIIFQDLYANRPNLLVAPNGFGKTSFANCFNGLRQGKLSIMKDHLHKGDDALAPLLELDFLDNGITKKILANPTQNEISKTFAVRVIKSKLKTKTKQGFGNIKATSQIATEDIVLAKSIPKNTKITYQKSTYNSQFRELRSNVIHLDNFLKNHKSFSLWFRHFSDITKLRTKAIGTLLETLPSKLLEAPIEEVELLLESNTSVHKIYLKLKNSSDLPTHTHIITLYQLISEYRTDNKVMMLHLDFILYTEWKQNLSQTLSSLNLPQDSTKITQSENKLVFKLKNISTLSNGERDALTFLADLYSAEYELLFVSKKELSILIIDEVFDCLDESNMTSCHYFISKMVQNFKSLSRKIFPLILTHLQLREFEGNKFQKAKVHFLKKRNSSQKNEDVRKILKERNSFNLPIESRNHLSNFFLHYSPCNKPPPSEISNLQVSSSHQFYSSIKTEFRNYLNGKSNFDPFSVCICLRIEIEKWAHQQLPATAQSKFLLQNKTNDKLGFAERKEVNVPEIFYLLGIIYNEALHVQDHRFSFYDPKINANLQNKIIFGMIQQVATTCKLIKTGENA